MTFPPTAELSSNWLVDSIRVYVKTAPALPTLTPSLHDEEFQLDMMGCARGFRYIVQSSDDLLNWIPIAETLSDGDAWTVREPALDHRFYRVALPEPSAPTP
jgi:hypothetical protein